LRGARQPRTREGDTATNIGDERPGPDQVAQWARSCLLPDRLSPEQVEHTTSKAKLRDPPANRCRLAEGFPKEIELAEAWNNIPGLDVICEVTNSDR
jgi:hypothetical protein